MYTYVTNRAVIPSLNVTFAFVTIIHEFVGILIVKFVEHGHGTEFGASKRREFIMFFLRHCEERITTVH